MRALVVLLVLVAAGCSSSPEPSPPRATPPRSWLGMEPGDARPFHGPGGKLLLIYVDETYAIDHTNASAITWELGDDYTTDYFVQKDDRTLWWYGRRGEWRATKHGEQPREVDIVDHRVTFGDRSITVSDDGPVELETPDGVYTS